MRVIGNKKIKMVMDDDEIMLKFYTILFCFVLKDEKFEKKRRKKRKK